MKNRTILVIEDDASIAEPLTYALKKEQWQVIWHTTGKEGLAWLHQNQCDFIVLDIGLPDMDGFEVCRKIRQALQTPLLFLTARNDEIDRIVGLEMGADDYCAKPFSPREITARIKTIWRRMENRTAQPEFLSTSTTPQEVTTGWGPWQWDTHKFQIFYYHQSLSLTRYEYGILMLLLNQPERVYSRQQIMQHVWEHPDHSLERTIDSHIKTLRQKLTAIYAQDPIQTHRGFGYSLQSQPTR